MVLHHSGTVSGLYTDLIGGDKVSIQKKEIFVTEDGVEHTTYESARNYEKKLEKAKVDAYDPSNSIRIYAKQAERRWTENKFTSPRLLVMYEKHGETYVLINNRSDLDQNCFNIVKGRLAAGYFYFNEQEKIAYAIVTTENKAAAVEFLLEDRGEYVRIDVESFIKTDGITF